MMHSSLMAPVDLSPFGSAFCVTDAKEADIDKDQLRRVALESLFHGVRSIEATPKQVLAALMRQLPEQAIVCGATAAVLHGIPLPIGYPQDKALAKPSIGVPKGNNRIRRRGVNGSQLAITDEEIMWLDGIKVTTPERTWQDLSGTWQSSELLAATDYLVNVFCGPSTLEKLRHQNALHSKAKGYKRRCLVLERAAPLVESPMESLTRSLLLDAGIEKPECNPTLIFPDGKRLRPDMLFVDQLLVVEYNGGYHGTDKQWQADEERRRYLISAGFKVINVVMESLKNPEHLVADIRMSLATRTHSKPKVKVSIQRRYF